MSEIQTCKQEEDILKILSSLETKHGIKFNQQYARSLIDITHAQAIQLILTSIAAGKNFTQIDINAPAINTRYTEHTQRQQAELLEAIYFLEQIHGIKFDSQFVNSLLDVTHAQAIISIITSMKTETNFTRTVATSAAAVDTAVAAIFNDIKKNPLKSYQDDEEGYGDFLATMSGLQIAHCIKFNSDFDYNLYDTTYPRALQLMITGITCGNCYTPFKEWLLTEEDFEFLPYEYIDMFIRQTN
jgi:hypothetical protein